MANLKDIRTRIASVKNTRQVTSAMKMVSAAKLRKAQDAIIKIRPYTLELKKLAGQIANAVGDGHQSPLADQRDVESVLVVLFTSNKGLCGVFNAAVTRKAINWANHHYANLIKKGKLQFLTIGRKGNEIVKREGYNVWKGADELLEHANFQHSSALAKELVDGFTDEKFDKIVLFYNQFKNAAVQKPVQIDFLPVEIETEEQHGHDDYILEPSPVEIIEDLMPRILQISFHGALLDSAASEHGARMTAMHKATDNATDLISELTLTYNKARQAAITNEITEIVSGANALGK